jgi:uncharacterized protein with GYD domain
MPRYLFIANYSIEGMKGVLADGGTARRIAVEKTAADVGGRILSFDFAFGGDDAYVVSELPDATSAAALAMTVNASGGATVRTIVLITPEEIDEAAHRRVAYTPPGG